MLSARQATERDHAFLVDVFLRAMRVHITAARGFWDESNERRQFQEQLCLACTRIINRNGTDVGFFMTVPCGRNPELHTICVAPEYQRQGVGTAIIRQIIDEARSKKQELALSVLKANVAARSLYERLGLIMSEELAHHYAMRFVP